MSDLTLRETLSFCTTKIDAIIDDKRMASGTGFFFNLKLTEERYALVIITNKHVAVGKKSITFYLSQQQDDGKPLFEAPIQLTLSTDNLKTNLYEHPNKDVDLCAITVKPIIEEAKKRGFKVFYKSLSNSNIPTQEQFDKLDAVEDIQMIGYPNALWDRAHNMPLVRKGITATWPKLDFNGKKEFLIDAACFPGSSGSPVFICDMGMYYSKEANDTVIGNRFMLLGIQYAVPIRTAEGTIVKKTLEESIDGYIAKTESMLNLGYIIKSECILDLIPVLKKELKIE